MSKSPLQFDHRTRRTTLVETLTRLQALVADPARFYPDLPQPMRDRNWTNTQEAIRHIQGLLEAKTHGVAQRHGSKITPTVADALRGYTQAEHARAVLLRQALEAGSVSEAQEHLKHIALALRTLGRAITGDEG